MLGLNSARWAILSAAPHRLTFLAGAASAVLGVAWWLADLFLRQQGNDGLAPAALPAPLLHAWLMLYGLFPFFVFGFLFTAVPNWLNSQKISRRAYVFTALGMAAGVLLVFVYPVPGLALHLAGWGVGLWALLRSIATAAPQDKRHAWASWGALLLGGLGNAAILSAVASSLQTGWPVTALAWGVALGTWGCLVPIFLTVCHRMVPWFTSRVVLNYVIVRPYSALWAMLLASLVHAGLQAENLIAWSWLVDLPLAAITLWFVAVWGLRKSLHVRLLAMLHIAFVWAGLAFCLFALDSLAAWLGHPGALGLAPLHALGMGFFAAMLVGMASRVSLGHSGHKLEADTFTWRLFWLAQAAALARMLAGWLGPHDALITVAGLLWLAAFGGWAWRYAPLCWRPRADGKPG